jgi:peptidoglycan L-alanyl-D-glutamate endopeptidase CwlK
MSRDLNKATPRMRNFAIKLIELAKNELGINVIITDVDRPYEVQMALYAQGRESTDNVNKLRKRAGLGPITNKDNKKVTWTMASRHIINLSNNDSTDDLSHAIDFKLYSLLNLYLFQSIPLLE